jgi:hypothetical protein
MAKTREKHEAMNESMLVRLPADLLARLDAMAARLTDKLKNHTARASVARMAIVRGLDAMEKEIK